MFAGTFAYFAKKAGKSCLVVEKRETLGGNLYCEDVEGIHVHKYGAHIFHTSNRKVWDFVNSLVEFNRYTNSPVANYKGEIYNMPFNMNTFSNLSRDTRKSSGDVTVKIFRLLSSSAFRYVILMITITLMISTRVSQSADIMC